MRLRLLLTGVPLLLCASLASAQFTREKFDQLKPSVVRVESNQCSGLGRSATGFFWSQREWVVTALHVVNGCGNVSIYSESAGQTKAARIVKVLRKQDLVLLALPSAFGGTKVIGISAQLPSASDELEALGYPLAIPKMDNTTVRLRYGGRVLRDIVPQSVADELKQLGSPDPSIGITDIEGHLLPGHSGAPILNSAGELVAIADGGLENGAVGVSWGIPASTLTALAGSNEAIPNPQATSSAHLFSAEVKAENGPDITCGGGTFKKIRTLAFGDILHATDDPLGLQQIVAAAGASAPAFRFDVYQQLSNGATFVVPKDAVVTDRAGMCTATSASGNVVIRAVASVDASDPTAQSRSVAYELSLVGVQGWQVDPGWTYLYPIQRFDGFAARRKSFVHFGFVPNFGPILDQTLFETLVARNGLFVGASALNLKWSPVVVQTQQACRFNPQSSPYCPQALADFNEWAQAVIAVHLSTIPIG